MKKVITILMLLCFCLNLMPNASFAAESLDEALGEVSIYNGGSELKYLSVNGAVRPMTYVYFNYVNRLGKTKEIPAYCVNPNDKGVAQVVQQGQSVKYSAADKASDPKVMGIIACGYPTRSLKELGLENAEEAYYATKTALWCYLLSSWDINKTAVNPNLSRTEKAAAERVLAAARDIYTRGTWWDRIYTPKLTVQADQEYAYPVTINGMEYLQQEVTVTSETWVEYYIQVSFADETAVPTGTKIVDLNNKETDKITFQSTGNGYIGKFKILYPKNSLNSSTNASEGAVQLNFKGNVYQYAVYYAVCAETDKYGKIQNYICDTDPTAPINISFMSKYKTNASVDKSDEDRPNVDNPTTALEIIKFEKGTNKPLSGAIFEVKGPQGDVLGSFSTDTNGKITLPLTLSGTYVVTEKSAPKNYLLSQDNTQTVTVSYNQTATVTFANEPYGDLRIEKIDGVSGESLADAQVEVKNLSDGTTYSGTTKTGGSLNLTKLKPGVYEVKEIAAPKGYKLDSTVYTAKVSTGEVTTVTLKNYANPGLKIIKYDEKTLERLPDTTFDVYKDTVLIGTFTTDELGEITLSDLAEGTYLVKEISTDNGHIVNSSPQEIEIKAGEERIYELVFFNAQKPGINLVKVDRDTMQPLANAKFRISQIGGSFSQEYLTDQNGEIDLDKLTSGAYEVKEISAPNGYLIDESTRIIQINANENAQFVFTNIAKPTLKIKKLDAITNDPLANAEFKIYRMSDDTQSGDLNFIGTYYTDEFGEIALNNLATGWYKITETKAPDGYELAKEATQIVYLAGGMNKIVTFKNTPLSGLVIKKVDMHDGTPLAGAKFQVKYLNGISGTGGTVIGEYTTSANGTIVLNRLKAGTYIVEETQAPAGYEITEPAKTVYLSGEEQTVISVEFADKKIGAGEIIKVDAETGKRLKGAEFELRKMNGEILGNFTTDENGLIHLDNLKDGWYQATETKAPKGYILDTTPHNFEIKDGQTASITVKNSKTSAILLHKIDSETKEGIYGVKFLLSDSNHKPLGTYESDQNGYVYIDEKLEDGKYYIREIQAAEGYNLDTKERTFYLRYGKTEDIIWENNAEKGQIQIMKKSADLNYTNGLAAGTPLPNAIFTVTNSKGKVVDTIQTDSRGIAVSKLLPLGYYTIEEIQAPAHYAKNAETITAHIEFSGQAVKFEVLNKSLYTNVAVEKKGYLEAMAGQVIRYDFPTVQNNSNVTLMNFYWRDILPTDAVRLEKISTGTWSENLNYKIMYKTNLRDYRLLKDNLQGGKNYLLDCSSKALNLASGEYVTEVMFSFGAVPPNFTNVTNPYLTCTVKKTLPHGYTFTNKTDVGGIYDKVWITANDWQTTKVYNKLNPPTLPKTGY